MNERTTFPNLAALPDQLSRFVGGEETAKTIGVKCESARMKGNYAEAAWQNLRLFRYDMVELEENRTAPETYLHMFERPEFSDNSWQLRQLCKDIVQTAISERLITERFPDIGLIKQIETNRMGAIHVPRRGALHHRVARMATEAGLEKLAEGLMPVQSTGDLQLDAQRAVAPKLRRFIETAEELGICDDSPIGREDALKMLMCALSEDVTAGINAQMARGNNR